MRSLTRVLLFHSFYCQPFAFFCLSHTIVFPISGSLICFCSDDLIDIHSYRQRSTEWVISVLNSIFGCKVSGCMHSLKQLSNELTTLRNTLNEMDQTSSVKPAKSGLLAPLKKGVIGLRPVFKNIYQNMHLPTLSIHSLAQAPMVTPMLGAGTGVYAEGQALMIGEVGRSYLGDEESRMYRVRKAAHIAESAAELVERAADKVVVQDGLVNDPAKLNDAHQVLTKAYRMTIHAVEEANRPKHCSSAHEQFLSSRHELSHLYVFQKNRRKMERCFDRATSALIACQSHMERVSGRLAK